MEFKVNLKEKEVKLEADIESLVEKSMEHKAKNPNRKTRYQIKQEEKRKNAELKHRQQMQYLYALIVLLIVIFVICALGAIFFD